MFGNLFSGWHIVILIVVVLLLFGATKLPALAKGVGESLRILRKETRSETPPAGPDDGGATGRDATPDATPEEPTTPDPSQRD